MGSNTCASLAAADVLILVLIYAYEKKWLNPYLPKKWDTKGRASGTVPPRNSCPCRCSSRHHCACAPGRPRWASGPCRAEYLAAHPGSAGYPY